METARTPSCSTRGDAPLLEQRGPIIFMLFLLLVSGITATVVGYRVKTADIDRKSQLLKTYEELGGSFERANSLGQSIRTNQMNPEQSTFTLVYEVNSRARTYGLYRVLETTTPEIMSMTVTALFAIGATESARSAEDARAALEEPVGSGALVKNINPKAARFARQYDRFLARDTEVKLFTYLRDHHQEIGR